MVKLKPFILLFVLQVLSCGDFQEKPSADALKNNIVLPGNLILAFTRTIIASDKDAFMGLVDQDSIYENLKKHNGPFTDGFSPDRVAYPYFFYFGITVKTKGPRDPIADPLEIFRVEKLNSDASMIQYSCTWRPYYIRDNQTFDQIIRLRKDKAGNWKVVFASLDW